MKNIGLLKPMLVFLALTVMPALTGAQDRPEYGPGRLIVCFNAQASPVVTQNGSGLANFGIRQVDALNEQFGCIGAELLGKSRRTVSMTYLLRFRGNPDIPELARAYMQTGEFRYAEPDYRGSTSGVRGNPLLMPDDTYFGRQWSLYNDGTFSLSPPKVDADIDMTEGWDVEQGDATIVIGIMDTGCKLDHPEFTGRIWINGDEIPGNGIDDDLNNYIDDVNGWDFSGPDNDPTDDYGHGTNVTGILGATGNNGIGYAGIDWNCKLMILKGINSQNWGYYSWWIDAIHYAVDNGAKALNMSVGGSGFSQSLQDAVAYGVEHNMVIVASMMNDNSSAPGYPAACPGAIAVGSTDPDDTRSAPFFWDPNSGSNYGSHISVVAPGNYIYGLDYQSNTNYGYYWGGTSQATPMVTGLTALLLAQDNARTPSEVREIIEHTAQDAVGDPAEDVPGWDQYYGWGRINAWQALIYEPQAMNEMRRGLLQLYPNPSTGRVQVASGLPVCGDWEITVTALQGVTLLQQKGTGSLPVIDLIGHPAGVCFVQLVTQEGTFRGKLILK